MAVLLPFLVVCFALHDVLAAAFPNGRGPGSWRSLPAVTSRPTSRQYGDPSSRHTGRQKSTEIKVRREGKVWTGWQDVRYLFTFGDSYTSTGFDPDGTQPSPGNPLGNPAYPGATTSNGPNYVDFLATTYNKSYVQTYNFAYGGATVNPALVASAFGPVVQSFQQQVTETFIPRYSANEAVPWVSNDTLFTIFFGINDVILSYAARNDSLNYNLIKDYESLVNRLYAAGARNFVFLNVPPIDRSPSQSKYSIVTNSALAGYIGNYNFRLRSLIYHLGRRHPDTTTFFLDTNWLFTRVINDPSQFVETAEYKNTTEACEAYNAGTPTVSSFIPSCGVPVDEYLWLNGLHPTYPVHNFIAAQIVQLFDG